MTVRKSVYLDSTIPSYLFEERESLKTYVEVTKKWWEEERQHFDVWISEGTIAELHRGEYPNKTQIIECIAQLPVLLPDTSVVDIARVYLANYLMPRTLTGDALRLAYASYYKIDFLLRTVITWLMQTKNNISGSSIRE